MITPYIVPSILLLLALRILHTLITALFSPLRSIPGPPLARFTKLWYLHSIYRGHHEQDLLALHRKHAKPGEHFAKVVRLAPNMYSISQPEKVVYGVQSKMPKSSWYEGWKHPSPSRWTLFTDRSIARHAANRRLYSSIYALSSLVSYESYVDSCTDVFHARLSEIAGERGEAGTRAGEGRTSVNLGHWFQFYAFDVIGAITYGTRFGFLDQGRDLGNTIRALDTTMVYSTLVGVYAWAHPFLFRVLERFPETGAAARAYLMKFAMARMEERKKMRKSAEKGSDSEAGQEGGHGGKAEKEEGEAQQQPQDFMDKMLDMQRDAKKGVTDYHVLALSLSNIFAGSDTTAVSLSSIFYHLIRTPDALQKLRKEVEQFISEGRCEKRRIPFKVSQEMPYLQACIKEGLRLHPATGLPMWRVVTGEGAQVCGQFFPAGSEVGINSWVAHHDEHVWGPDASVFRPERWLEAEGERLKVMESYWIPFGMGSRTCLGRHISHLEMSKLVPYIVMHFDFELQHPERRWNTHNSWFVKPTDFMVYVRAR